MAYVAFDHHSCCVLTVEISGRYSIEKLVAKTIIGVQKNSHELISFLEFLWYTILSFVVLQMQQAYVLR